MGEVADAPPAARKASLAPSHKVLFPPLLLLFDLVHSGHPHSRPWGSLYSIIQRNRSRFRPTAAPLWGLRSATASGHGSQGYFLLNETSKRNSQEWNQGSSGERTYHTAGAPAGGGSVYEVSWWRRQQHVHGVAVVGLCKPSHHK